MQKGNDIDVNKSYLILTDVNSDYNNNNAFKYLQLHVIQNKCSVSSQEKKNEEISLPFCESAYTNLFRDGVIPKLFSNPSGGASKPVYKKTPERVQINNKKRVVYKYKNAKYVIWNKEYQKISTLKKSKDIKITT